MTDEKLDKAPSKSAIEHLKDGPLSEKSEAIAKEAMSDGMVTSSEFKRFTDSITEDLEVTKQEVIKGRALYKKALADNDNNIVAIAEINKAWSSSVPAPVYNETTKTITDAHMKTIRIIVLMFLLAILVIFLESLLPILQASLGIG
jgi:hypothetical protein